MGQKHGNNGNRSDEREKVEANRKRQEEGMVTNRTQK
jgi:hypothetical protein